MLLALNVGADAFVGHSTLSLQRLEGRGEALNLVAPTFVTPASIVVTQMRTPSGQVAGHLVGVGTPGAGISVTRTQTTTLTYRGAVDTVATAFCNLSGNC